MKHQASTESDHIEAMSYGSSVQESARLQQNLMTRNNDEHIMGFERRSNQGSGMLFNNSRSQQSLTPKSQYSIRQSYQEGPENINMKNSVHRQSNISQQEELDRRSSRQVDQLHQNSTAMKKKSQTLTPQIHNSGGSHPSNHPSQEAQTVQQFSNEDLGSGDFDIRRNTGSTQVGFKQSQGQNTFHPLMRTMQPHTTNYATTQPSRRDFSPDDNRESYRYNVQSLDQHQYRYPAPMPGQNGDMYIQPLPHHMPSNTMTEIPNPGVYVPRNDPPRFSSTMRVGGVRGISYDRYSAESSLEPDRQAQIITVRKTKDTYSDNGLRNRDASQENRPLIMSQRTDENHKNSIKASNMVPLPASTFDDNSIYMSIERKAWLQLRSELEKANELQGYYKKIAEEQRARCLAVERELALATHTHDFELERAKNDQAYSKQNLEERLQFQIEETERQINAINKEKTQEITEMFTDNKHLAQRLSEAEEKSREFEKQVITISRERDDYLEKLAEAKRDHSFKLSQVTNELTNDLEKTKRESEDKIRVVEQDARQLRVKCDYDSMQLKDTTTRDKVELERELTNKINRLLKQKDELESNLKDTREDLNQENIARREQEVLRETAVALTNESQNQQKLMESELGYLRVARKDVTKERDDLIGDLKGHQDELENLYAYNKTLKHKIRRMEQMLYGRNIVKIK